MIKTCYTNIESCVKVNGYTSIYFNLSRGIRQGCPISTLLYVLVANIWLKLFGKNRKLKELGYQMDW